jgi:hypothetical protein
MGAASGAASDAASQWVNGDPFRWSELLGSALGGAAGGLFSGGALTPIGGVKPDFLTNLSAAVVAAQTAYPGTLVGWAIGQQQRSTHPWPRTSGRMK